jgi:plasmid stabilization system protein ParE
VRKLYKRVAARRDLVEHFVSLAAEGGEALAERFLSQAEAACEVLLHQPEIGSRRRHKGDKIGLSPGSIVPAHFHPPAVIHLQPGRILPYDSRRR